MYSIGSITRNQNKQSSLDSSQQKLFDSLSVASIVDNRVDTGKQKVLGLKEFKYFINEYQGEKCSTREAMALIMVSLNMFNALVVI